MTGDRRLARAEADERKRILKELREITKRMERAKADYPRRRELLRRGRAIGILHRELGEACGVSESAVIKDLSVSG